MPVFQGIHLTASSSATHSFSVLYICALLGRQANTSVWVWSVLCATQGAILLPLPGVQQLLSSPTDAASAGSTAGVAAACEAWSEVLQQLVVHCPKGTDLLVDALQLHMTACKLHMHQPQQQRQQDVAGSSRSSGHQQPPEQQQHQRRCAAAARECVQAWAFVCQWVMQARVSSSQAALTRLAAMAHSMSCVYGIPEWHLVAAEAAAAAAVDGGDPAVAADAAAAAVGQLQQQQGEHGHMAAGVDASTESLPLTVVDSSRDFEAGFKGVPPPEPSSEPSALARLWTGTGAAVGQAAWGDGSAGQPAAAVAAADAAAASAAAALAAAEGVCWPQAFLTGCALLIQVSRVFTITGHLCVLYFATQPSPASAEFQHILSSIPRGNVSDNTCGFCHQSNIGDHFQREHGCPCHLLFDKWQGPQGSF